MNHTVDCKYYCSVYEFVCVFVCVISSATLFYVVKGECKHFFTTKMKKLAFFCTVVVVNCSLFLLLKS